VVEDVSAFNLTFDENDDSGVVALLSSKTTPLISPEGFLGDGIGRALRVQNSDLPSWIDVTTIGIQADIKIEDYKSEEDYIFDFSSGGLVVRGDIRNSRLPVAGVNISENFIPLFRKDWVFQDTTDYIKDIVVDGINITTLSTTDTGSTIRMFSKTDFSTQLVFSTNNKFESLEADLTNPDILWAITDDKHLVQIDGDYAFTNGIYKEDLRYNLGGLNNPVAITWVLDGSSVILAVGEYSGVSPCSLWLIDDGQINNGGTFSLGDEMARYELPIARLRELSARGMNVYVSYSGSSFFGQFGNFDLTGILGVEPTGFTIPLDSTLDSPSPFSSGIGVDPLGDIWMTTTGYDANNTPEFWNAFWKYDDVTGYNTITLNVDRVFNTIEVKNNFAPLTVINSSLGTISDVSFGASWNGSSFQQYASADIKNVAFKNRTIDFTEYEAIQAGSYEPNTLTEYNIDVLNPSGIDGVNDWTNRIGTLQSSGEHFLGGSSNSQTEVYQTINLSDFGITTSASDGTIWINVVWEQSGEFDGSSKVAIGVDQSPYVTDPEASLEYSEFIDVETSTTVGGTKWRRRVYTVELIAGSTQMDLYLKFSGDDAYVRNIIVSAYKAV